MMKRTTATSRPAPAAAEAWWCQASGGVHDRAEEPAATRTHWCAGPSMVTTTFWVVVLPGAASSMLQPVSEACAGAHHPAVGAPDPAVVVAPSWRRRYTSVSTWRPHATVARRLLTLAPCPRKKRHHKHADMSQEEPNMLAVWCACRHQDHKVYPAAQARSHRNRDPQSGGVLTMLARSSHTSRDRPHVRAPHHLEPEGNEPQPPGTRLQPRRRAMCPVRLRARTCQQPKEAPATTSPSARTTDSSSGSRSWTRGGGSVRLRLLGGGWRRQRDRDGVRERGRAGAGARHCAFVARVCGGGGGARRRARRRPRSGRWRWPPPAGLGARESSNMMTPMVSPPSPMARTLGTTMLRPGMAGAGAVT